MGGIVPSMISNIYGLKNINERRRQQNLENQLNKALSISNAPEDSPGITPEDRANAQTDVGILSAQLLGPGYKDNSPFIMRLLKGIGTDALAAFGINVPHKYPQIPTGAPQGPQMDLSMISPQFQLTGQQSQQLPPRPMQPLPSDPRAPAQFGKAGPTLQPVSGSASTWGNLQTLAGAGKLGGQTGQGIQDWVTTIDQAVAAKRLTPEQGRTILDRVYSGEMGRAGAQLPGTEQLSWYQDAAGTTYSGYHNSKTGQITAINTKTRETRVFANELELMQAGLMPSQAPQRPYHVNREVMGSELGKTGEDAFASYAVTYAIDPLTGKETMQGEPHEKVSGRAGGQALNTLERVVAATVTDENGNAVSAQNARNIAASWYGNYWWNRNARQMQGMAVTGFDTGMIPRNVGALPFGFKYKPGYSAPTEDQIEATINQAAQMAGAGNVPGGAQTPITQINPPAQQPQQPGVTPQQLQPQGPAPIPQQTRQPQMGPKGEVPPPGKEYVPDGQAVTIALPGQSVGGQGGIPTPVGQAAAQVSPTAPGVAAANQPQHTAEPLTTEAPVYRKLPLTQRHWVDEYMATKSTPRGKFTDAGATLGASVLMSATGMNKGDLEINSSLWNSDLTAMQDADKNRDAFNRFVFQVEAFRVQLENLKKDIPDFGSRFKNATMYTIMKLFQNDPATQKLVQLYPRINALQTAWGVIRNNAYNSRAQLAEGPQGRAAESINENMTLGQMESVSNTVHSEGIAEAYTFAQQIWQDKKYMEDNPFGKFYEYKAPPAPEVPPVLRPTPNDGDRLAMYGWIYRYDGKNHRYVRTQEPAQNYPVPQIK